MNIRDYRQLCQKNAAENYFLDKYLFRKISIYVTVVCIRLGMTANQATFVSLLCALAGAWFLQSVTRTGMLLAVLFVFLYYLLDHVDGELARYRIQCGKQQPSLAGTYFDVLVHKFSANLMLFFLGVSVWRLFGYSFAVIVGFTACISISAFPNLLASQVLVQKIAGNRDVLLNPAALEILELLEKKQLQIARLNSKSNIVRAKKALTELLFFPGSLLSIMLVTLADLASGPFYFHTYPFNFRLLFLLFAALVYLANTIRQTLKWLRKFKELA